MALALLPREAVGTSFLRCPRTGWRGLGQPDLVGGTQPMAMGLELDDLYGPHSVIL